MARTLITSALPYINGVKHLGNLVGSQLPSDVYARYLRARGHEVLLICATDEHGTPAELAAAEAGEPVADYCARLWQVQKDLVDGFRLSFDHYGRSSSPENHGLTQHFAGRLADAGLISEVDERQIYSPADGRFLPDRYVEGTCPNCGYPRARGDQCENCTKQLDPTDLIEPRSAISGSTDLEVRETRHLYLRQSLLRDQLRAWIETKTDWPVLSTSIALKWLDDGDGLQDRSITRDLDWGIPVRRGDEPWPGMEGKVFYVWFDAPIEYIAATAEWADANGLGDAAWRRWWRTDEGAEDVRYVQFMGKDNVPFHTLSFPATILGSGEPWKLVDYIKSFNYLNYEGGKFSTSQGRGVFMDQALEILPPDYWRWWLMSNVPEGSDSNFTWESFQAGVNKDLADVLGNFVSRVTKFAAARLGTAVPDGAYGPDGGRRRRRPHPPARQLRGEPRRDRAPQGRAGAPRHLGGRQRVPAGRRALDRDQDRPRPGRGDHPLQPQPHPPLCGPLAPLHPRRGGRDARRPRPRGRGLAGRRGGGARSPPRGPPLHRPAGPLRQARRHPPRRSRGPLRRRSGAR